MKACPNLTLQDVVTWPNEMHVVDVYMLKERGVNIHNFIK